MTRLTALLLIGGAAVLVTPAAAPAQFVRPFGLPGGAPLTVPIVPPVQLVPTVRLVPPVRIVNPVIGFPQFRTQSSTMFRFGNISFSSRFNAVGPAAWAFRPNYAQDVIDGSYVIGWGNARTDLAAQEADRLMKAQREAGLPGGTAGATVGSGGPMVGGAGQIDALPKALGPVDPAAVNSGEALNDLLKEIVRAQAKGAKGPSAYVPTLVLDDVRFAGSPAADLLNLARQADNLEFPAAFDSPALAGLRTDLAKDFAAAAAPVRAGKAPEPAKVARLEATYGRVQAALEPAIKNVTFEEAAAARRFVNRMGWAIKALRDGSANGLIDPKWASEGLTVADLVKHMTRFKLVFGPAPYGSEDAYATMYRNLATDLFVLTQPKK